MERKRQFSGEGKEELTAEPTKRGRAADHRNGAPRPGFQWTCPSDAEGECTETPLVGATSSRAVFETRSECHRRCRLSAPLPTRPPPPIFSLGPDVAKSISAFLGKDQPIGDTAKGARSGDTRSYLKPLYDLGKSAFGFQDWATQRKKMHNTIDALREGGAYARPDPIFVQDIVMPHIAGANDLPDEQRNLIQLLLPALRVQVHPFLPAGWNVLEYARGRLSFPFVSALVNAENLLFPTVMPLRPLPILLEAKDWMVELARGAMVASTFEEREAFRALATTLFVNAMAFELRVLRRGAAAAPPLHISTLGTSLLMPTILFPLPPPGDELMFALLNELPLDTLRSIVLDDLKMTHRNFQRAWQRGQKIGFFNHRNTLRVLLRGMNDLGEEGGPSPDEGELLRAIDSEPITRQLFEERYGFLPSNPIARATVEAERDAIRPAVPVADAFARGDGEIHFEDDV